jgi:hypothetical protein
MASKRPYFSSTGPQLQSLFEANRTETKVLRDLLAELKHRSTPTATALKRDVEEALASVQASGGSAGTSRRPQQPPPSPAPPEQPPSHHTLTCRGCSTALRVPVRPERTTYNCPTCKTDFETFFKDGLLQVTWVESKSSGKDASFVMTDELAREILGVTASSDFAAIKAAWRRASQQYHPDKHQALPERLRRAAEAEMKRINEAFRFLEGNTAADF